jgi:putative Mg2+ transporter-C (MgtC) family protein
VPLAPEWPDLAARLLLTLLACAALGIDRGESGQSVGIRTVALVGLAAALSMIAANLLLTTDGKTSASFSVLDLMRLPLGILTGMGFIGAGAIIKHRNSIEGLTTAATIWFATMLGIVFGSGLFMLGLVSAAAGCLVLTGLRPFERRFVSRSRGLLRIVAKNPGEGLMALSLDGVSLRLSRVVREGNRTELEYRATWPASVPTAELRRLVEAVERVAGVEKVELRM